MKDTALAGNPVRVSLPASVAADIGSLKKAVGSILDHLGCQACCSGHDILFELQRDYMLKDNFKSRAQIASFSSFSGATIATRKATRVNIGLKPEAVGDIEQVYLAIDRIAELTGHPACATGCDMFLQMEQILVMDEALNVQEQVMRFG